MNPLEVEIDEIKRDIKSIKHEVVEHLPPHFSVVEMLKAGFGAMFIGLTFMFKDLLIEVGLNLPVYNVFLIVASTILILSAEIYYIGYAKVKNKRERPFAQFYFKRLLTLYGISFIVSFYLCYIFGFLPLAQTFTGFLNLVLVLTMPCSLGAAVSFMFKKD
ncbi:DUF2391 family protein [Candidatus Woesearchaeota archaeon]|nr:DUF2391 family protein [Candidatus Woesearchaeota archaeon]